MTHRPDPDELLRSIQAEEEQRGKLKIFLGYAAGVGKTYAMLEAAHQRRQQGVDVVIGYIETHGRAETDRMVEGLEILPSKTVNYRDIKLSELDVDAVLTRKPSLVLVDEFAHTNAPGLRHVKRYQDVEEILDAGIDVYTTLNIQHLESLNDVVAQVTGVTVRETVPDRLLDQAFEIEVIDLPPDELLSRLQEGRVYVPEQAARAIEKFFRKGNLTALRELSLRRAAVRVDDQMRAYMQTRAILGPWATSERLVVCVSPSPLAERLIRNTRRLADDLNAQWFAVYVELTSRPENDSANRERIGKALRLAEELGAKSHTIAGNSISEAVIEFARKNNITKVVVGKPLKPRWQEFLRGSVVDQLIYASGDIDIYVVSAEIDARKFIVPPLMQPHRPFGRYLASLGLIVLATLLSLTVRSVLEPTNLVMLYITTVVVAAVVLGRGPSLLAAVAAVLSFDFFLVPPYYTFVVNDTQYLVTFAALLVVGLVISSLTARVGEQARAALNRERHSTALYNLGRDLNMAKDVSDVGEVLVSHIHQAFDREVAIFLPQGSQLGMVASTPDFVLDDNEQAVASWVFEHGQPAGRSTDTLPASPLRCEPLHTGDRVIGVLGIRPRETGSFLTPEQRQTLSAFANYAALAIERASLADQAQTAELLQATDKLQTALLNSISHDLRTPLVSITGALTSLDEQSDSLSADDRGNLLMTAREEADRLNRLVGNLLSMTRIESGAIKLHLEIAEIQDVVGSALEQLGPRTARHSVKIDIADDFPLFPLDFALMVQAMVNLIENAAKYSPAGSLIEVSATRNGDFARVEISDRGMGIPVEDLTRVFDKFYRTKRPESVGGTGLGLSISKGIVEAHGGRISARQRPGGGTILVVDLPLILREEEKND